MISRLTGKPPVIFSKPIREFASLSLGERGNSVSELQQQLKQLGYYKNEITGIYGNADAVAQFQKKYSRLSARGSVDLTTKQLLGLGTNFKQQFPQTHQLNSTDKSAEPMGKIQGIAIRSILLSDIARSKKSASGKSASLFG
ncbi:peptidoglycan-binding domain-containing protein [Microcoleus sp. C2C3]|uniref:peptidoglycan-binding domain-containing protein n=1 Tax=unclassified Microcoleus TaxID=2642155 RepID=UPI002FCED0E5